MKKIHLLIFINSLFIHLQAQNFDWAKREGQGAYDYGYGIANDTAGNVYISGKYELNANFSGILLPMQGNHDIYTAKYSKTGALIWIRTAGGFTGDYAHALACDGTNYVYITGEIQGSGAIIKFLGSPITLTCQGENDMFFAKYDLNGNLIWANRAGGVSDDEGLGITYDNAGNVYITGFFTNSATFGTTTINGYGGRDIYVAKYDMNGVFQWVKAAGSAGRDEGKSIKLDAFGNVYICGMYSNAAVFGSQTLTAPNGYFNSFLAKYAPDGTLVWVKTSGGDYDDLAWSLTIDNSNKIYVTGEFNAYAHFDGIAIPTTGSADVFVACYDDSGTIQWVRKAGGRLVDRARGIGCDGTNLYITGQFSLSANFGSYSVTGIDSSEIFMAKISNAGEFQWVTTVAGEADSYENLGYESGIAICAEASGNVYATGALLNGGLFGNTSLSTYNRTDVFISKISQNIFPPQASPLSNLTVMVGQSVSFNVFATGAPILNYQWQKNGVNISGATASSFMVTNAHYNDAGQYRVVVSNIYGIDTSNAASLTVIPFNASPKAFIISPSNGTFYHAGDVINFSGSATDAEDGNIPASAFEWTVDFANNIINSFIPGPIIPQGTASGSFVIPNTGDPSPNVFYRLRLKVTDSNGLIDSVYVDILPLTSTISINTQPSGLKILFNNQVKTSPFSTLTVEGLLIPIGVVSPQNMLSQAYAFSNWQHGGAATQTILAGEGDSSYTAVFNSTGFACIASGMINREFWTNVTGSTVASVPVNTVPSNSSLLTIFEGPPQAADNYGQRIRGYICPPSTGDYTFWIASDDNSELWLSTDEYVQNKVKIASVSGYTSSRAWTKYPSQQSIPISLIAGAKYYIEAIHKEGTQGDNLAVGWQLPNGTFERPIPGTRLSPFTMPLTATIASPINNSVFIEGSTITIETNVTGEPGTIQKVEFFADSTKLGEDLTSPYNFIWNNVSLGNYELTSKVIASGNTTAVSSKINVFVNPIGGTCNTTGVILREIWNNISGTTISTIPINAAPSLTEQLSIFQSPSNIADNYGQRIRGYVCPPVSGNYIFWIASDDNSELWLSTNDNPANKQKIASVSGYTSSGQWTKYTTQQSIAINLTAGLKYYIEALHKEGGFGDNCAVGWQLPNGTFERPIPGTRLSPFIIPLTATIASPINNSVYIVGSAINIQASASGGTGTIQKVEFFAGTTSLGEDLTSPYSVTWNNAAIGSYALTAKVTDSGNNSVVSTIITIIVNAADQLTTVISSPANNTSFNAGSPISILASASGGTGTIQKVEFFAGTTSLGEDITSPYSFIWNNAAPGNYALTAKVTDSGNNSVVSTIINITVNNLPLVTISSPGNLTSYPSPANITVNATATSNGGSIAKVEFYQGSTKIGEDLTAPYGFTWMNVPAGNYALKAKATDNTGLTGVSQVVNIIVTTCSTPVIIPSGPTTMCSGSVILQANTGSGYLYQWKKDGVNMTGATNSYITVTTTGSYQVKVIQGSCISWSAPASVKIQNGLMATITPGGSTTFCAGGNVKLFASTCSGYTYQWKKDGAYIPGANDATYIATIGGNYQLQITQAGVNAWSAVVEVTVNNCRASETDSTEENNSVQTNLDAMDSEPTFQMKVYPNPNTGLFTIILNMPLTIEEKVKMRIVNIVGQEVYNKEYAIKDNYIKETVELNKSLPTGIYTLQVIIGNNVENTSVILAR